MSAAATTKQSVHRAFALIDALRGQTFSGLRLKQIADLATQSPSTTLRDLETLAEVGIVERLQSDKDRWRLAPKLVQVAIAHQAEIASIQQRLDDTTQRYSRTP